MNDKEKELRLCIIDKCLDNLLKNIDKLINMI